MALLARSATAAVFAAQARTIRNLYPRHGWAGVLIGSTLTVLWYGLWCALAFFTARALAAPSVVEALPVMLPNGLLLVFLYWQLVPLLLVSSGLSLDSKKLRMYPIRTSRLFAIESLLRLSSSFEMVIISVGAGVGLMLNPGLARYGFLVLAPFAVFNILLSVGIKDLLTRWLERRGWREAAIFGFVLLAATPQYIGSYGLPSWLTHVTEWTSFSWMPWGATAELILGRPSAVGAVTLPLWLLGAYGFARWQFEQALRFDRSAERASERASASPWWNRAVEAFYRFPGRFFADPLAVLIEKELRFLSRAPRFRLVFLMGFSFGIVLWVPMAFGNLASSPVKGVLESNFFTVICVYALTLLGEVALWNNLGFDRSAAQMYFLAPLDWTTVLLAKNIAGVIFLVAEVGVIGVVMLAMQMPLGVGRMLDALVVTLIFAIYLFAVGNLGSVHYPRPMDPAQSWRANTGSRFQFMLLIVYPLASLPILLAYAARHVAHSEWLFYGVLALDTVLAVVVYRLALYWAVNAAETRREQIVSTLTAGTGPIG